MTSPIDDLLARARVLHEPCTQQDIDAATERLAARIAATNQRSVPLRDTPQPTAHGESAAAEDLTTLCETVIAHGTALNELQVFFAQALPEPSGARVLGCMLQLSDREESARFWWQYAAGAGDPAATYCLALHHRALGEHGEADWWHTQTDAVTTHLSEDDLDPATALRILRALKVDTPAVPDTITAVLDYVPAAVAYVDDDLDLPLPDPDFTDRIETLTTAADPLRPPRRTPQAPLPERKTHSQVTQAQDSRRTPAPGER